MVIALYLTNPTGEKRKGVRWRGEGKSSPLAVPTKKEMNIDLLALTKPTEAVKQTQKAKNRKPTSSFSNTLLESIQKVNDLQKQADKSIEDLATGENRDVAQTMIAVEKANISFQLMTQIRNRIVETYQEVMRMQV